MQKCSGVSRGFLRLMKMYVSYSSATHCVLQPHSQSACSICIHIHYTYAAYVHVSYNVTWSHLCRMGCGHRRLV